MGASGLDDAFIFLHQAVKGCCQAVDGREELVFNLGSCSNVHGRRERVIGTLGHIRMVIWMDQLLTGNLIGPVGNDLIYVHIGLSTASGLPYS